MGLMGDENGVREEYTQDGTTNLKGKPVLRSTTGKWRACYFMLGENHNNIYLHMIEFCYRLISSQRLLLVTCQIKHYNNGFVNSFLRN